MRRRSISSEAVPRDSGNSSPIRSQSAAASAYTCRTVGLPRFSTVTIEAAAGARVCAWNVPVWRHCTRGEAAEGIRGADAPPLGADRDPADGGRCTALLPRVGLPRGLARRAATPGRRELPRPRPLDCDPRRLLPALHRRLAEDARRLGPADPVLHRAPGGDGVDSREVRAGHGLDPGGADRVPATRRCARHAARAELDGDGGGALGARRHARLLRQPDDGRLQRCAGPPLARARADRDRGTPSARLHAGYPACPAAVRSDPAAAPPLLDAPRPARLLLLHVARRRYRALLPAALAGR